MHPIALTAVTHVVSDQLPSRCMHMYTDLQSSKHTVTACSCQPANDKTALVLSPFWLPRHYTILSPPVCKYSIAVHTRSSLHIDICCPFLGNTLLHVFECSNEALANIHGRCLMPCVMTSTHEEGSGVCGWTFQCSRGRGPLPAWRSWSSFSKLLSKLALRPGLQRMKKRYESCLHTPLA